MILAFVIVILSFKIQAETPLTQGEFRNGTFSDCENCPEMVLIPSGKFLLGSDETDPGHQTDETPQIEVSISSFAISKHEITLGEFRAFVDATGYEDKSICLSMQKNGYWGHDPEKSWRKPGFEQTDSHPVVCVSWKAAHDYIKWLNDQSGSNEYRLLTESEWEYAARAGSSTVYWWGDNEDEFCNVTNGVDQSAQSRFSGWVRAGKCNDGYIFTAPVGHYQSPNDFGVEDLVGNVWEWVSDCYAKSYKTKPRNGSAYDSEPCEKRVMRGGAWGDHGSFYLRSAYRGAWNPEQSFTNLGLRVAKILHR